MPPSPLVGRLALLVLVGLGGLAAAGCNGLHEDACVWGASRACSCDGGRAGAQACPFAGRWAECSCEGGGDSECGGGGLLMCGDRCADPRTDGDHCGECDRSCSGECEDGFCRGGARDAGTDAGHDAGTCHDETGCTDIRTRRSDLRCTNQLQRAIGNDCDYEILCGVALYEDGRYSDFRESTIRANTDAEFGFGSSGGCNAGSGARWVARCTLPDDPRSCRMLPRPD